MWVKRSANKYIKLFGYFVNMKLLFSLWFGILFYKLRLLNYHNTSNENGVHLWRDEYISTSFYTYQIRCYNITLQTQRNNEHFLLQTIMRS